MVEFCRCLADECGMGLPRWEVAIVEVLSLLDVLEGALASSIA